MWTAEHRRAAERRGLRYPSDLTDAEWALIAPMIPPAKRGGRKRSVDVREVLNGIFYRAVHGLPVECTAQGSAAEVDGVRLFRSMGVGWHAGADPS